MLSKLCIHNLPFQSTEHRAHCPQGCCFNLHYRPYATNLMYRPMPCKQPHLLMVTLGASQFRSKEVMFIIQPWYKPMTCGNQ